MCELFAEDARPRGAPGRSSGSGGQQRKCDVHRRGSRTALPVPVLVLVRPGAGAGASAGAAAADGQPESRQPRVAIFVDVDGVFNLLGGARSKPIRKVAHCPGL